MELWIWIIYFIMQGKHLSFCLNSYNFKTYRAIPLERYDCPVCKTTFFSRIECHEHIVNFLNSFYYHSIFNKIEESEHSNVRKQRPHFCDICLRSFNERQALSAHQEHHKRVQAILDNDGLKVNIFKSLLICSKLGC